jgi:hypothetical protein
LLEYNDLTVDVAKEAGGKNHLYEPRYINVSVYNFLFLEVKEDK